MNDIATKWVLMTVFVFTGGALVALVWSVMAGHWQNMHEAALIPLEDGDYLDDNGRLETDTTDLGRRTPDGL